MSDEKKHKKINLKPALYAIYYPTLRNIAYDHGYNLLLHGSLGRDMDLVAVPWAETLKPINEMLFKMSEYLGYKYSSGLPYSEKVTKPHNRTAYVLNAGAELYLDISIFNFDK